MPTVFNTFTRTFVTVPDTSNEGSARKTYANIQHNTQGDTVSFGTGGRPKDKTGQPPKTITSGNKN